MAPTLRDRVLPEPRDRGRLGALRLGPRVGGDLGCHSWLTVDGGNLPPGPNFPGPRLDFWSSPMRTIWNGSISFGLVSIPVGLALATKPAARQSDVSFRQLHRECLTPIKQKRWCPTHDREVGPDEIVRGWEVAKGEFVIVEDADLEAIEQPTTRGRSRSPGSSRSPRSTRSSSTAPTSSRPRGDAAQRRPYVLLLEAMKETEMAALGRFVLRGQEHSALIRAWRGARARDALPRRGRALPGGDRGSGRGTRSRRPSSSSPAR